MLTVPSFTINKKEFFTLWVKHYLLSMKVQTLKEKFLYNKEVLQATNFTTTIDVDFAESEDVAL